MARLTTSDYDRLERAVATSSRVAIVRGGRELVVVPLRLFYSSGREFMDARHPTTGDTLSLRLDDLDALEFLP